MNAANVPGVYREGKVILEEPVDWPEGSQVQVLSPASLNRAVVESDMSVEGLPCINSPAAIAQWVEWLESLKPALSGEELERFEANLRSAREAQRRSLASWQERVDHLIQ